MLFKKMGQEALTDFITNLFENDKNAELHFYSINEQDYKEESFEQDIYEFEAGIVDEFKSYSAKSFSLFGYDYVGFINWGNSLLDTGLNDGFMDGFASDIQVFLEKNKIDFALVEMERRKETTIQSIFTKSFGSQGVGFYNK